MNIIVFSDGEKLTYAATDYIVKVAQESIASHGRFTFALSGGTTPRKLYAFLARTLSQPDRLAKCRDFLVR